MMMEKYILLFALLIINGLYSQVGVEYPLSTRGIDVPNGSYIKDLNNEYFQYIGVWKGTWGGKTLTLDLRKVKSVVSLGDKTIFRDKIVGERKIINSQGIVEIDRISNFDSINGEFYGINSTPNNINQKQLQFYPKDMCNKSASLDIHFLNAEKTEMRLVLKYNPSWNLGDCKHQAYIDQYGDYPINFPKDIVLVKQN